MEEYQAPQTTGDEVRLMFQAFDRDGDGTVQLDELKELLQKLDPELWTDDALNKLLKGNDANGDGELQFTEFWAWVNGHGSCEPQVRDTLMQEALDMDHEKWERSRAKALKDREREEKRSSLLEAQKKKEEERAAGERVGRQEYVEDLAKVGVDKRVAGDLFRKGDDDNDGEIDKQELGWLNTEHVLTDKQIKGVFERGIQGTPEGEQAMMRVALNTFKCWDEDGDGTISAEELVRVIQVLNPKLGQATAEKMMKQADTNGDGQIDFQEFVAWMSGAKLKKKKDKEVREARIAMAITQRRAEECQEKQLQKEFEDILQKQCESYCTSKNIAATCNNVNYGPGAPRLCKTCKDRHVWVCHGCGFISYYDDCINGCNFTNWGWTCINGQCKKKCGCRRKPDFYLRTGYCGDEDVIGLSMKQMLDSAGVAMPAEPGAEGGAEAAAP